MAEILVAGKVSVVRRVQAAGRAVAIFGDGINDAIGTKTDVSIESSDITLLSGGLYGVPTQGGDARPVSR